MSKELVAGQKILQYEVVSLIGTGGMSRVYLAQDQVLNRRVALKQVLTEDHDSRSVIRLQQEGQSLARLSHLNIVKILTFFTTEDGTPFLVMELLHGCSLAEYLSKNGSLSLGETMQLAKQMCGALEHAHEQGIVHRDIKPSNIFLCGKKIDAAKIIDFGIAKITDTSVKATRTGEFMGSPAYLSPEQALQKQVTPQSDQYSLACVLYECLAGRAPFEDETAMGLILKHINDEVAPLGKNSFVPPAVAKAIERALKKDPESRFPSMSNFEAALNGKPAAAQRKSYVVPILISSGIVLLGLTALVLFTMFSGSNLSSKPVLSPATNVAVSKLASSGHVTPSTTEADYDPERLNADTLIEQQFNRDPNLQYLELNNSNLSKAALTAISKKTSLYALKLIDTNIDDSAGPYIAKLSKLNTLDVSKTAIGDAFIADISSLQKLDYLSLGDTNATSGCGKSLQKLKAMKFLWFRSNAIDDSIGDELAIMPALEVLDMQYCPVTDDFVQKISALPKLNYLALNACKITQKCIPYLSRMRNLRAIYLDYPAGAITDISALKDLQLKVLSLKGAKISKNTIKQIFQFKGLVNLRLDQNGIKDSDLVSFASLPKLKQLYASKCVLLTKSGVDKFKKLRPDVQLIQIDPGSSKGSQAARDVVTSLDGLQSIKNDDGK